MSRKRIDIVLNGARMVKVFRDSETNEYIARLYVDGTLYEPADCFEDVGYTKQSASDGLLSIMGTARAMAFHAFADEPKVVTLQTQNADMLRVLAFQAIRQRVSTPGQRFRAFAAWCALNQQTVAGMVQS